jgi:hypothetical protein
VSAAPNCSVCCLGAVAGMAACLLLLALAADASAAAGVCFAAELKCTVRCRDAVAGVVTLLLLLGVAADVPAGALAWAALLPPLLLQPTWPAEDPWLASVRGADMQPTAAAEGVILLVAVLLPPNKFKFIRPLPAPLLEHPALLPLTSVGVMLPPCCCSEEPPPVNPVKQLTPLGLSAPAAAAAAAACLLVVSLAPLPAAALCRRAEKGRLSGVSDSVSQSEPASHSLPASNLSVRLA